MALSLTPAQRQGVRILWVCALVVVVAGSLLAPSSKPMELINEIPISDKVEHFSAYFVLAFLPALHERARFTWGIAAAMILLGVALEYGQLYEANGRDFELFDMAADTAGVLIGVLLAWPFRS
jgi:VanZ family protein